jgi:biopolymer transport protein ExbD
VQLQPPTADDLPGTDKPTVAVAVDSVGRYYFANKIVGSEAELKSDFTNAVENSPAPLTLIIHADESVTYTNLLHLTLLARDAGIQNALLATLPRLVENKSVPQ